MRIFFDTEFTGLRQDTQLISIALVDEKGEAFYAEFIDVPEDKISAWLSEHVVAHLWKGDVPESSSQTRYIYGTAEEVKQALMDWLARYEGKELHFWGDVPHYDWVLFCELFGGALEIPKDLAIHYMPMDIATWLDSQGIDKDTPRVSILPESLKSQPYKAHHALDDARVLRAVYQHLSSRL